MMPRDYHLRRIDGTTAAKSDLRLAQELRHTAFHGFPGIDADRHDATCQHILVETGSGGVMGCYRYRLMRGAELATGYSAQFYDLQKFFGYDGVVLELGRFCLYPGLHDPDLLRLLWGALAQVVDGAGVGLMIGCSSFRGTDPAAHGAAFAAVVPRIAPERWQVGRSATEAVALADFSGTEPLVGAIPPLLRTYLGMGGWVGDHAVIDRVMGTTHIFTGVEVAQIPPARASALRRIAAEIEDIFVG